jgi:hypothetical protein
MLTTPTSDGDAAAVELHPEYWLVVLLRAMRRSDLSAAGEAQQRLRELGIEVRFPDLLPEDTISA